MSGGDLVRYLTHVACEPQRGAFLVVEQRALLEFPDTFDALRVDTASHTGMCGVRLTEPAAIRTRREMAHQRLELRRDTRAPRQRGGELEITAKQRRNPGHREKRVRDIARMLVKKTKVVLELA